MDEQTTVNAPLPSEQEQVTTEDPADKLTPEHPRFKQVIAENHELKGSMQSLKEELAQLKEQVGARQEKTGDTEYTFEELQALDRIERGMKSKGYVTKADLEAERRVIENSIKIRDLTSTYSGKNGYPKFDPVDDVLWAKQNGYGDNYEMAFKDRHWDTIVQVEAKRLATAPEPPKTEKPGGSRQEPEASQFTPERIAQMSPAEYEKYREDIMASMRPQ